MQQKSSVVGDDSDDGGSTCWRERKGARWGKAVSVESARLLIACDHDVEVLQQIGREKQHNPQPNITFNKCTLMDQQLLAGPSVIRITCLLIPRRRTNACIEMNFVRLVHSYGPSAACWSLCGRYCLPDDTSAEVMEPVQSK
eukprot:1160573-Pelagomonas_calceolata.AAC.30